MQPGSTNLTNSTLGTDDPRIAWRGDADPGIANTTLAAVGDPDTGMFFSGTLLQKNVRVETLRSARHAEANLPAV